MTEICWLWEENEKQGLRSLFSYFKYLVSLTADGSVSPPEHM